MSGDGVLRAAALRIWRAPRAARAGHGGLGRIHTSAATVAVLLLAEDVDVSLNEADLRIDTMRAGARAASTSTRPNRPCASPMVPTGIVVLVQDERSQHKNKARAIALLKAKLFDAERQRADAARAADRARRVGSGDRSERIRTYNFPQDASPTTASG